jgi:phosphoserine phosphatase
VNIFIVRHGETEWNKEEIFRGTKDIPLNTVGRQQAERAGAYFADKGVQRIFSSPLTRAYQTAEAISRAAKGVIEKVDNFTDMNFGQWEGHPVKEVENLYPEDIGLWREQPQRLKVIGGETLSQVRRRVATALQERLAGSEGDIVVVTHRVICKVLVLHLMNIPNEHFWKIRYDPAGISLVVSREGMYVVSFINDTCHLKGGQAERRYRDF